MNLEKRLITMRETIQYSRTALSSFDHICPLGCNVCEEKETLVLLPTEETFWMYPDDYISAFRITSQGYLYILESDEHCPFFNGTICSDYDHRPIDCRIHPLYPVFNINDNTFLMGIASSYCPMANSLPREFIMSAIKVCTMLNRKAPLQWKKLYNEINLREPQYGDAILSPQELLSLYSDAVSPLKMWSCRRDKAIGSQKGQAVHI